MDKTRLQCFGALYGGGSPPSTEEVTLQLQRERAEHAEGESERSHQMRLHRWLMKENILHFAPYNEGCQDEKAGRIAKMMGLSPGIPDLVFPIPRKPHHGLYLELKRQGRGVVGGAQEWWLKTLLAASYEARVSWSFDESVQIINDYLALPEWEAPGGSYNASHLAPGG